MPPAGTAVIALQAYRELEARASQLQEALAAAQGLLQKRATDERTAVVALQAEHVAHQEALVSYREMNASYVAEYRELQTRAAQLEEALAAATAAAADYERLETRSAQLEDALAAQLAYSATALQRWVRSRKRNAIPFFTTLADVAFPSSRGRTGSDTCSTRAAFGGRQHIAAVSRPVIPADLGPSLTLSTSRSPSRANLTGWFRTGPHF